MARINYPKELVKPDGRRLISGGPRDMQQRFTQRDLPVTQDSEMVDKLLQKIEELSQALSKKPTIPDGFMSPEQVDQEIRTAVESAVKETTMALSKKITQSSNQTLETNLQKYKVQIVDLQKTNDDLIRLHSTITEQNSLYKNKIEELESKVNSIKDLEIKIAVLEQSIKDKDETINILKNRPVTLNGESIEDPNRPKIDSVFIDPLGPDAGQGLKSFIHTDDVTREEKEEMKSNVNKLKSLLGKLPTRRQED
jgi:hypothetical protein